MIQALLLSLCLGGLPQSTIAPLPQSTIQPVKPAPRRNYAGWHSHKCGVCGLEFWHGPEELGFAQSHRCPHDGSGPWFQVYRKGAPPEGATISPIRQPKPAAKSRMMIANCPTGH